VQFLVSLAAVIAGAELFVGAVEVIAQELAIPALVLSLLLAPPATELPEKTNSVLWIRREKDTLAVGTPIAPSASPVGRAARNTSRWRRTPRGSTLTRLPASRRWRKPNADSVTRNIAMVASMKGAPMISPMAISTDASPPDPLTSATIGITDSGRAVPRRRGGSRPRRRPG